MMRAFSLPLIAAFALAAAAPASAATALKAAVPAPAASKADTGVTGDVRCLLVMTALASNKERQQAGQVGVYFFAGRISARAPGYDLTSAVKAQAPTLGPQQLQAELQRCGPMVATAAQNTQAAITSLRPPGAPAPTPAAPAPAAPLPAPK
jgi:hypothetical protein